VTDRIDVLQDVLVLGVAVDGAVVLVDVYGSTSNVCGSVRFHLPDPSQQRTAVDQIAWWRRQDTPLTLIARHGDVVLQNDHAVFGSRMTPSAR